MLRHGNIIFFHDIEISLVSLQRILEIITPLHEANSSKAMLLYEMLHHFGHGRTIIDQNAVKTVLLLSDADYRSLDLAKELDIQLFLHLAHAKCIRRNNHAVIVFYEGEIDDISLPRRMQIIFTI